jgi:hypothetical protein
MMFSKACDITAIVAIACARHGFFAPNSIVNLFRGEQQKNVDYSFLQALKTTNVDPDQNAMLIYDIACQYFVHFEERIGHLLPAGLEIDKAIGLFHVHGHKDECFYRYAPSFIPKTGVVAGEILESLWAGLNTITPTMRTATLAHRAEVIDDHANNSNYLKILGIGKSICWYLNVNANQKKVYSLVKRFQQAADTVKEADEYYEKMTESLDLGIVEEWEAEIVSAEAERYHTPAAMDIMGTRLTAAGSNPSDSSKENSSSAEEEWIALALAVEEKQSVFFSMFGPFADTKTGL